MSTTHNINIISITTYNLLAKIVFFVFMLGTGVYASRVLSQEQFGQAQYATWIVSIAWIFGNLGIPATVHRNLAAAYTNKRYHEIKQLLRYSFWSILLSISLSAGVVYLLLLSDRIALEPVLVISLLVVQFAATFFQFVLQGMFAYRQLFVAQMVATSVAFVYLWFSLPLSGVEAYIQSYILYNSILLFVLSFPVLSLLAKTHSAEATQSTLTSQNKLWQLSGYFALSILLASVMWQRPEAYFIEKYMGYTQLSVYLIAFNLVFLATEPIRMLSGVLISYFSGLSEQRDQLVKVYTSYTQYLGWLAAFLGLYVYCYAPAIVKLLYTESYSESADLLRVFIPFFMLSALNQVSVNLLIGLKKVKQLLYFDVINFLLFLVMLFWVFPTGTLNELAWGKGIIHLWSVVFVFVLVYRLAFRSPLRKLLLSIILAIVCIAPVYYIFPNHGLWWQLLLSAAVPFIVYFVLSIRLGLIEREMAIKIQNRLLGRVG